MGYYDVGQAEVLLDAWVFFSPLIFPSAVQFLPHNMCYCDVEQADFLSFVWVFFLIPSTTQFLCSYDIAQAEVWLYVWVFPLFPAIFSFFSYSISATQHGLLRRRTGRGRVRCVISFFFWDFPFPSAIQFLPRNAMSTRVYSWCLVAHAGMRCSKTDIHRSWLVHSSWRIYIVDGAFHYPYVFLVYIYIYMLNSHFMTHSYT